MRAQLTTRGLGATAQAVALESRAAGGPGAGAGLASWGARAPCRALRGTKFNDTHRDAWRGRPRGHRRGALEGRCGAWDARPLPGRWQAAGLQAQRCFPGEPISLGLRVRMGALKVFGLLADGLLRIENWRAGVMGRVPGLPLHRLHPESRRSRQEMQCTRHQRSCHSEGGRW